MMLQLLLHIVARLDVCPLVLNATLMTPQRQRPTKIDFSSSALAR